MLRNMSFYLYVKQGDGEVAECPAIYKGGLEAQVTDRRTAGVRLNRKLASHCVG
jgi:hypothetical protein